MVLLSGGFFVNRCPLYSKINTWHNNCSDPSKRNNALIGALRHCIWTDLPDCPQISLASIGASHSNGLKLDLWLLPSNFQLKQHHTNFEAVSHVASCGPNLRIGYSKLFLKPCDAGFTRRTLPTEPLTVHSDPDAPTLIVRVSSKGDELTFADLEFGREYLQKHKSYELEESENVYDEVANNYRKATAGVGYFMPAYLSELLVEDVSKIETAEIIGDFSILLLDRPTSTKSGQSLIILCHIQGNFQ